MSTFQIVIIHSVLSSTYLTHINNRVGITKKFQINFNITAIECPHSKIVFNYNNIQHIKFKSIFCYLIQRFLECLPGLSKYKKNSCGKSYEECRVRKILSIVLTNNNYWLKFMRLTLNSLYHSLEGWGHYISSNTASYFSWYLGNVPRRSIINIAASPQMFPSPRRTLMTDSI